MPADSRRLSQAEGITTTIHTARRNDRRCIIAVQAPCVKAGASIRERFSPVLHRRLPKAALHPEFEGPTTMNAQAILSTAASTVYGLRNCLEVRSVLSIIATTRLVIDAISSNRRPDLQVQSETWMQPIRCLVTPICLQTTSCLNNCRPCRLRTLFLAGHRSSGPVVMVNRKYFRSKRFVFRFVRSIASTAWGHRSAADLIRWARCYDQWKQLRPTARTYENASGKQTEREMAGFFWSKNALCVLLSVTRHQCRLCWELAGEQAIEH